MSNIDKNMDNKYYEELILEIKKELPNIVLPSMGMLEENKSIDIDGKDFVISNKEV